MLDSHSRPHKPRGDARRLTRCAILALLALAALPATASATHNDEKAVAEFINQPGTPLGSFSLSHSNLGDPTGFSDEFTQCGGVNFGSSVWYRFHPHHNGRFSAVVQRTSGNLEPVIVVFRVDGTPFPPPFPAAPCNAGRAPLFRATLPADGPPLPLTGGVAYFIQIGGVTENDLPPPEAGGSDLPTEGDFNLAFNYDPNTDGDALFDSEDRCDSQPGSTAFQGCPDSDNDGLADPDDRCPSARGPANFRGCPDTDRDGLPDPDDRCPRDSASARDPNKDGCLDLHRLVDAKLNHNFYARGIVVSSLEVLRVPRGARVSIKCRRPRGRRNCGSSLIQRATTADRRAKISRTIKRLRKKQLPFGANITIRATKRGATGKYIRYKVVRGTRRFNRVDRCTNVGSTRLRKRGCT